MKREQYLAALSVNLLTLIYGISIGWAAPNMILFQSKESPVGQLTMCEISTIASLLCVGGVSGNFLFGIWVNKFGRKILLLLLTIPQAMSFILILVGDHHFYIYASRILAGFFGGGVFIIVPIFVSEISDPKIRGTLGSMLIMFFNIGIMAGFLLTSVLEYKVIPYVILTSLVVFILSFIRFPETPECLVLRQQPENAEKSFKFYNGKIRNEDLPLKDQKFFEKVKLHEDEEKNVKESKPSIYEEFKDKAASLGLIYSIITVLGCNLSGSFVVLNYMTLLFEKASIEIDIYLCTIVVGGIQIVGSCLALILVDKLGRRILYMISCLGSALMIGVCGYYYYLVREPTDADFTRQFQWIPLVTIAGFVFIANLGMISLPFFMISELLPVQLRGPAATISMVISWIAAFFMLHFFHVCISAIGIYGTMGFFSISCFIEFVFIYLRMPETKGLTLEQIQEKLYENRV